MSLQQFEEDLNDDEQTPTVKVMKQLVTSTKKQLLERHAMNSTSDLQVINNQPSLEEWFVIDSHLDVLEHRMNDFKSNYEQPQFKHQVNERSNRAISQLNQGESVFQRDDVPKISFSQIDSLNVGSFQSFQVQVEETSKDPIAKIQNQNLHPQNAKSKYNRTSLIKANDQNSSRSRSPSSQSHNSLQPSSFSQENPIIKPILQIKDSRPRGSLKKKNNIPSFLQLIDNVNMDERHRDTSPQKPQKRGSDSQVRQQQHNQQKRNSIDAGQQIHSAAQSNRKDGRNPSNLSKGSEQGSMNLVDNSRQNRQSRYLQVVKSDLNMFSEQSKSPRVCEQLLMIENGQSWNRTPKRHINVTQVIVNNQTNDDFSSYLRYNKRNTQHQGLHNVQMQGQQVNNPQQRYKQSNNNNRKNSNNSGQSTPKSILKSQPGSSLDNSIQRSFQSCQSPRKNPKKVKFSLTRRQVQNISKATKC